MARCDSVSPKGRPGGGQAPRRASANGSAGSRGFSLARAYAIALKEFVQMRRDRLTFAMIVGIPIAQVLLFGYGINTDPKSLPTAVV